MNRRLVLKEVLLSFCLIGSFFRCSKEKKISPTAPQGNTVDLNLSDEIYADLRTVGGALRTSVDGIDKKVIIIRRSETTVSVLSDECTHAGCPVNLPQNGQILCACHNSLFDLDGSVIQGPANLPLPSWSAVLRDNVIKITV